VRQLRWRLPSDQAGSEGLTSLASRSVDARVGVRARSDQFVTSGLSLPVVYLGPPHPEVVHPRGSQCGSRRSVQQSYALRACHVRCSRGSRPALASGSQVAVSGRRWLLTAVRGHLGGTLVMRRPGARWSGVVARPSVFQAWRTPSCRPSGECCAPSSTAAASGWLLLLLSPLLSGAADPAAVRLQAR
jgi:hypothetical protein